MIEPRIRPGSFGSVAGRESAGSKAPAERAIAAVMTGDHAAIPGDCLAGGASDGLRTSGAVGAAGGSSWAFGRRLEKRDGFQLVFGSLARAHGVVRQSVEDSSHEPRPAALPVESGKPMMSNMARAFPDNPDRRGVETIGDRLARLIDLTIWLDADFDRDDATLAARDAALRKRLNLRADAQKLGENDRLDAWREARRRDRAAVGSAPFSGRVGGGGAAAEAEAGGLDREGDDDESLPPGERVDRALAIAHAMLAAMGAGLGLATTAGLFYYNGQQPVNVVHVLGVLVGLQGLTLIGGLVLMAPARPPWLGGRRVPLLAELQSLLAWLSPGRWMPLGLGGRRRARARRVWGQLQRTHKWLALRASQIFAVAFNLGALAAAAWLIVFTDRKFGWATTLDVEPETVHTIFRVVCAPWAWLWPDASPDLTLIESSRIARDNSSPGQAAWWPFLVIALAVYGLLPRLILLAWARRQLQRSIDAAFRTLPGLDALRRRLGAHAVLTRAEGENLFDGQAAAVGGRSDRFNEPTLSSGAVDADWRPDRSASAPAKAIVVRWSDPTLEPDWSRRLGVEPIATVDLGGVRSPEEDEATIERLGSPEGASTFMDTTAAESSGASRSDSSSSSVATRALGSDVASGSESASDAGSDSCGGSGSPAGSDSSPGPVSDRRARSSSSGSSSSKASGSGDGSSSGPERVRPAEWGSAAVVVMVRGWEPPLAELADALSALRASLGRERTIWLAPVDPGSTATDSERSGQGSLVVWRRFVDRVGDPRLGLGPIDSPAGGRAYADPQRPAMERGG